MLQNLWLLVLPWEPEHIVMNTDYHTDWYACKRNNLKRSPPVLTVVPRLCDFVTLSHKHRLFLLSKSKGAETVCPVRDMSVWVMCSCVGVLSSPLCLWPASPRPRPFPSLHIIQWPETRGPKNLTISSIFLMNPIFCLRAQGLHIHPSQL